MLELTPRGVLLVAAASVALLHTLIGVDHYLPFVVLGRARKWTLMKVAWVTAACGVGHVMGSIVLGFVGIALGTALGTLTWLESLRGAFAAWGLIAFGLAYAAWGLVRLKRGKRHSHVHLHSDGSMHDHDHDHHREHLHGHPKAADQKAAATATFWSLFVVFALGPCEPLIPVLMAPAFEHDWWLVAEVTAVFSAVTIGLMVSMAVLGSIGLRFAPVKGIEKYVHVIAGMTVAVSGLLIQMFDI